MNLKSYIKLKVEFQYFLLILKRIMLRSDCLPPLETEELKEK